MPNSREAEQAVLGSILISPKEVMPKVLSVLDEDCFETATNKNIFNAAKSMYQEGKAIDVVTLISRLGDLDVDIQPYLVSLVEIVSSVSAVDEYISIVEEESRRRKAANLTYELANCISIGKDLNECSELAQGIQTALNRKKGFVSLNAEDGFYKAYISLTEEKHYYLTGFQEIDKMAHISPGDYVVIGARPSTGKTAITLQMMMNMAKRNKVVYFSLETSAEKLYQRMISCFSLVPLEALKTECDKDKLGEVSKCYGAFKKLSMTVVEAAGWTVEQIKAKAIEEQADIIFIDYLTLIKSKGNSRYEQITNISIDLHTMAQQTKTAVVALSQLSRNGDEEPRMTDLRESGQIEQDADIVMLLSRNELESDSDRVLQVAKNKEGRIGRVTLGFDGSIQRFFEYSQR